MLKRIDNAVFTAADEAINGTFTNNLYVGTLENDGVGLAPYHDLADMVPSDIQDEVEKLKEDIISGAVSITG